MLPVTAGTIRLALHLLGATVWVGGQLSLAFLAPVLRRHGTDVARAAARRYQQVAWPAFALLLGTGIWNLFSERLGDQSRAYLTTVFVKLALVALSGLGAASHALLTGPRVASARDEAEARRRRALSGATAASGLLFALGAAFCGILLRG